MQKRLIVALLVVIFTAPALAAETFYIIFDDTLKGCTIATAEPTDKIHVLPPDYYGDAVPIFVVANILGNSVEFPGGRNQSPYRGPSPFRYQAWFQSVALGP